MNQKKYLIFGSGFIASHLANNFKTKGQKVTMLYQVHPSKTFARSRQKKITHRVADIKKVITIYKPNFICLTQGVSYIPHNEKDLKKSINSNVTAPLLVLEAIRSVNNDGIKLKRILTFGSAAEYNFKHRPSLTREHVLAQPSSLYGLTKQWLYLSSRFYARLGLPVTHLRLFNIIGAGQNPLFVVSSFCRQVALIEKRRQSAIIKIGDLGQQRDFVDVRDLLSAVDIVLNENKLPDFVDICSGKTHFVRDIIEILKQLSATSFKTKIDKRLVIPFRSKNKIVAGNPDTLIKLGWKPRYNLRASVEWTLDYWRKNIS